eukprot:1162153-Pelagomonas_calceolata.AAC.10
MPDCKLLVKEKEYMKEGKNGVQASVACNQQKLGLVFTDKVVYNTLHYKQKRPPVKPTDC